MLFNSFDYVVFLVLVFVLYWAMTPSVSPLARAFAERGNDRRVMLTALRTAMLLLASFLFYMSWNAIFLLLFLVPTLIDYWTGLMLGRTEREGYRKALLAVSLVSNLGLLGLFKYYDFGMVAVSQTVGLFGIDFAPHLLRLILPVGISFYTFQTLSYTIDVYRRRLPAHRDILEFATYVAFFPQLVAGPIVRASEFLHQFRQEPRLSARDAQSGIYLILRGLVKKVAVADVLATHLIDRVFESPDEFSATEVWLATIAYSFQLYTDFSGYTDVARGSSRLLGFELPENFDRPYNTTGPIEFWRNWHMTLSRWVQDYLYIPMGGSHHGELRTYRNLFISIFVIGIWHGANWTFVVFGLWHASTVTLNHVFRNWRKRHGGTGEPPEGGVLRALMVSVNFIVFSAQWVTFRSPSIERMLEVYEVMLTGDLFPIRVDGWVWLLLIGMCLTQFAPIAWVKRVEDRLMTLPWPAMSLLIVAVGALLMHVAAGQTAPFIYFQF